MVKKSKADELTDFLDDEDDEEVEDKRGHNSGVAGKQLMSIIERIERLEEEKKGISTDIKEIYQEAKANGFDTPTIRTIIKLRKIDAQERAEKEALLDTYLSAIGLV